MSAAVPSVATAVVAEPWGDPATKAAAATRALLAGVAAAAGIVGAAMLAAPGSTGRFFSWSLAPEPVAALVGACYVVSAVVFGWAAWRESWVAQRGLCIAVLGLAGPTLVATAHHRDVFDFHRWQAVAWVVLFAASVTCFASVVLRRPRPRSTSLLVLGAGARTGLVALAVAYAAAAVVLWSYPTWVASHGPVATGPLGVRFLGSWAAFLAIGAAHAAVRPRWDETRVLLASLVLFPLGAGLALVAHAGDLRPGPAAVVVAGLTALALGGLSVLAAAPRVMSPPTRGGAVR